MSRPLIQINDVVREMNDVEFAAWQASAAEREAEQARIIRAQRNALLAQSDWTQGKDIPDAVSSAWAAYRQALRDVPAQPGFPLDVAWPSAPDAASTEETA